MTEADLQSLVVAECGRLGLLVFHSTDSRRDIGPGLPDLIIAGRRGVLWREEKDTFKAPTGEQVTWKYTLLASGQDWGLWQPGDWESGRIAAELAAVA